MNQSSQTNRRAHALRTRFRQNTHTLQGALRRHEATMQAQHPCKCIWQWPLSCQGSSETKHSQRNGEWGIARRATLQTHRHARGRAQPIPARFPPSMGRDWLMPDLPERPNRTPTCSPDISQGAERPRTRSPTHSLQLAARREGDRGRALFHGIVDVPDDGQEAPLVRLDGDRW